MIKRTNKLVGTFDYVCVYDDAIDSDRDDLKEAWRLYLDGQGEPPIKAGETPTTWKLRVLSGLESGAVEGLISKGDQREGLILAALLAMVGAEDIGDKAEKVTFRRTSHTYAGTSLNIADPKHLDEFIDPLLFGQFAEDIGMRVWVSMRLRPS